MRALAGPWACGLAGRSTRPGPAWPWASPFSLLCPHRPQTPLGFRAPLHRASIREKRGCPGASRPVHPRGRLPQGVAPPQQPGPGPPQPVPGSPWASSWACAMGSSGPGSAACSRACGAAGPGGLSTLGSRTSRSLGSRVPGAPGRDPDGCFAKAWTFLRVRGPPARASAMAWVATWQAGAPVQRLVRRSQKRTYVVETALHAEPFAVVLGGVVLDGLVASLPLAPPSGLVRPVPFEPGPAWAGGPPQATTARARQVLERLRTWPACGLGFCHR